VGHTPLGDHRDEDTGVSAITPTDRLEHITDALRGERRDRRLGNDDRKPIAHLQALADGSRGDGDRTGIEVEVHLDLAPRLQPQHVAHRIGQDDEAPLSTKIWWWRKLGAGSGLRSSLPDHSRWRYLTLTDATWHQHGVYHPPPGTDVLVRTVDGAAVLYIDDKVSSPGTLVVASLDPMYHFGSYFMPATERFLCGFFPWMTAEL